MCGIAGFIYKLGNIEKALRIAERLHRGIRHRGREAKGIAIIILKGKKIVDILNAYARNIEELYTKEFYDIIKRKTLGADRIVIMLHSLHSVVNHLAQPLIDKDKVFVSNCEIYNWKKLGRARNDAEALFRVVKKYNTHRDLHDLVKLLDGQYALAMFKKSKLLLMRDPIGINPLWYSPLEHRIVIHGKEPYLKALNKKELRRKGDNTLFIFSSEKSVLIKLGIDPRELNPRSYLLVDMDGFIERHYTPLSRILGLRGLDKVFREYLPEELDIATINKHSSTLQELLIKAVEKRIPNQDFGILFSGGLDSAIIALIAKRIAERKGVKIYLFTAYTNTPRALKELEHAKELAKILGVELIKQEVKQGDVEKIIKLISSPNPVKIEVGLVTYTATLLARRRGIKVMLTGLGADDVFIGYNRQRKYPFYLGRESYANLLSIYEKDL
ncbi:MAG: hypothetical protein DRN88_05625, partial [Candidatus Hydrothermarchaeota archaeon]